MLEISKKYVKSIFDSSLDEKSVLESFLKLLIALDDKDFRATVLSPNVLKSKKEELVLSLLDVKDGEFKNLIKLLIEKNRLEAIGSITKELEKQVAQNSKVYEGIISSKNIVAIEKIEDISLILSKKLDVTVNLKYQKSEYEGVLVEVEYLGVRIGFSWDRLKQSLQDHILKAI